MKKKMKKKRSSVIDDDSTIVVDHNDDDHDRCYQNRGNHHHRSRRRRRRRRKTADQTLPHESSAHVPTTTTTTTRLLHHYKPINTRGCGSWPITTNLCTSLIFTTIIINIIATIQGSSAATVSLPSSEPYHTTANLGENVILRCVFDFPEGYRVPYVIQWEKKGIKIPIYIWYDGYHPHIGEGYEDRVSLSGRASLNLTNVRESDQGWYECKVFFLNRPPEPIKNGTWIHLDVLAPPRFRVKPPDVIYVKVGESVTLPCEAYGTPTPQITWYKDNKPLKANSNVQIYNHELQIDNIQLSDIGEYRCTSRNREGSINAITKIIIAGPAVITIPPKNITKLQGDRVEFLCEARALPSNVTYRWYHDGQEIGHLPWQESRFMIKSGMLIINPSVAEDSGNYVCEVSNGIGSPDTAEAYLNIEFPARVYYSPTIQYLPLGLSGIVRCFIQASPPFQFVTWTKDRRPFDPNSTPDVTTMNNGSLYMKKVSLEHQGIYRCTPYNIHGTAESSQPMEVLVRDPPMFTRKPKEMYIKAVNDEVSISCDGSGQPKPNIFWRKSDGSKLPRERTTTRAGNLTIKLLKKEDHGQYECVAENEIATIAVPTMIIINNTTPHTPTNISVNTSYFAATVQWQPNYNGGYEQTFHLSYRLSDQGDVEWKTVRVPPPETTNAFTLYNLQSDNEYEFQVYASNRLGAGSPSPVVKAKTKPWSFGEKIYPTDASGATYIPTVQKPSGPKPDAPRNLTLQRMAQGWVLSWLAPVNNSVAVAYYRVEYRRDDDPWLYTDPIPYDTAFLFEKLEPNSRYIFRVWAYSILGVGEVSPMIEVNIDDYQDNSQSHFRAMVASIIGGFIFFSMSIMLALCIVKVCNKKKRRKIEKSYVMVTCPVNGNSCYSSDNSVPSKQQFEMFDPNSQATSEFMINLPIGVGSLDISNVGGTAPSLDNSTTTTNTTGTTGSDQPLVVCGDHQQQQQQTTPTLMANNMMMGQWPTNVMVHKACYQSGAINHSTAMAIRQQQGSSMLMAASNNSPSSASSHYLVDHHHQPSPTYTMMMSNIGVSEMQTIQPYPSGPVVNRLMMNNHTHNNNNNNLDSNNPSISSSQSISSGSNSNTNSHTHNHHISNHHLHHHQHNHPPPPLQDHYPPPPPPAPPNDVL